MENSKILLAERFTLNILSTSIFWVFNAGSFVFSLKCIHRFVQSLTLLRPLPFVTKLETYLANTRWLSGWKTSASRNTCMRSNLNSFVQLDSCFPVHVFISIFISLKWFHSGNLFRTHISSNNRPTTPLFITSLSCSFSLPYTFIYHLLIRTPTCSEIIRALQPAENRQLQELTL